MIVLSGYKFSLSKIVIRTLTLSALALVLPQADIAAANPQSQVKSRIEMELEQRNAPAKKVESDKKGRTSSRAGAGYTRVSRESSLTIISDVPGAEILVDGLLVGKTDETKKLTTRVKKGSHHVTARLKGYNSQTMIISVAAERSTHSLNLGKPIPAPAPVPTPVAKVEPTPAPPPAPPPPSADDIIRRFINPKETAEVTAEDWNQVLIQTEEDMKRQTNGQLTARLHLARGQQSYLKQNYAESLIEFNRAIEVLPMSGIAYYGLGNAYLATNQPLQAHKTYVKASSLTPEVSALAYKGIGDALTKLEKRDEANASYIKARELGYISSEVNKSIARNLIEEKEWQKALAELTEIEDGDKSAEIQLYLGECYANLKRPLSAYRAYAAAGKLDPNSAMAFWRLGDLLYENNEFPEARDAYERALALDTTGNIINRTLVRKLADKAASLVTNSSVSKKGIEK